MVGNEAVLLGGFDSIALPGCLISRVVREFPYALPLLPIPTNVYQVSLVPFSSKALKSPDQQTRSAASLDQKEDFSKSGGFDREEFSDRMLKSDAPFVRNRTSMSSNHDSLPA